MRLFVERLPAPNPRRVAIFLAEKGIEIPTVRLDMRHREHKTAEHLARNPLGQLPTLELDDGACISESVAICRYLERLHPQPPLFGESPLEQALVDQYVRQIEFQVMVAVGLYWRAAQPRTAAFFQGREGVRALSREVVAENRQEHQASVMGAFGWLDQVLGRPRHLVGDRMSMADIVGFTSIEFAAYLSLSPPDDLINLQGWRKLVASRPSVAQRAGAEDIRDGLS